MKNTKNYGVPPSTHTIFGQLNLNMRIYIIYSLSPLWRKLIFRLPAAVTSGLGVRIGTYFPFPMLGFSLA